MKGDTVYYTVVSQASDDKSDSKQDMGPGGMDGGMPGGTPQPGGPGGNHGQ